MTVFYFQLIFFATLT